MRPASVSSRHLHIRALQKYGASAWSPAPPLVTSSRKQPERTSLHVLGPRERTATGTSRRSSKRGRFVRANERAATCDFAAAAFRAPGERGSYFGARMGRLGLK
ncbi:hypothetical protein MRX96_010671 [Rhipicephalus microplus]